MQKSNILMAGLTVLAIGVCSVPPADARDSGAGIGVNTGVSTDAGVSANSRSNDRTELDRSSNVRLGADGTARTTTGGTLSGANRALNDNSDTYRSRVGGTSRSSDSYMGRGTGEGQVDIHSSRSSSR